jgi:K+/H+ antiporter YhaU regulatory subunit KhtT
MLSIISLLIVLSLSLLITRIATVMLSYTGLSRQTARFQARSALTGVGFTTTESEKVVNHPVRRRILFLLMLVGNAGIVGAISSLIVSFVDMGRDESLLLRVVLLFSGIAVLWTAASSQWVDRHLSNLIGWALERYTRLDVRDYASMLRLAGEYAVSELQVEAGDWLADRALQESRLREEGVIVLGINRKNGNYLGAPDGATRVHDGDTLILYGRSSALARLDERKEGMHGDVAHREEVDRHQRKAREEQVEDAQAQAAREAEEKAREEAREANPVVDGESAEPPEAEDAGEPRDADPES